MSNPTVHPISIAVAVLEHSAQPYSILQIGAFTGATANDPLWSIFSSGEIQHGTLVCVEPVPEYFDELTANYAPFPNVRCLNLAVTSHDGFQPIYRLSLEPTTFGQPDWLKQISSLHTERLSTLWNRCEGTDPNNETAGNFYRQFRCSNTVRTATLKTTLELAQLHTPDMLIIDAEGSEPEIVAQITTMPRFVCYEHALMEHKPPVPPGFTATEHGMDTFLARQDDELFQRVSREVAKTH